MMGLFLDWEWRYIQTDRMNIEAKNVSTIFLSWFSGQYDSLWWPLHVKSFSISFD